MNLLLNNPLCRRREATRVSVIIRPRQKNSCFNGLSKINWRVAEGPDTRGNGEHLCHERKWTSGLAK